MTQYNLDAGSIDEIVAGVSDIAPVWSGMPVGFDLFTSGEHQYAAFYDPDRRMVVAQRNIGALAWTFAVLPEQLGWDSHNSVAIAVDSEGLLHLSGNMHGGPLVYFRSVEPHNPATLVRIDGMIRDREDSVTYPAFFRDSGGDLLFAYRDGYSGNGNQIFNRYDSTRRTWMRLLEEDLTDGEGMRNAYLCGPICGPDGYYHIAWTWRETPHCETNHDLLYARSKNLLDWRTSDGAALDLPIRLSTAEVVDSIPEGAGIINGNIKIGFDGLGRTILSYQKHDDDGYTQVYAARLENNAWRIYRTSDWRYRWDFKGVGTIPFEVRVYPVRRDRKGRLVQRYSHDRYGDGIWVLDPQTLIPTSSVDGYRGAPAEVCALESPVIGMQVNVAGDSGRSPVSGARFVLKWESLPENRDQPRDCVPPPSTLRLYELADSG
jgi:hypothetical protein